MSAKDNTQRENARPLGQSEKWELMRHITFELHKGDYPERQCFAVEKLTLRVQFNDPASFGSGLPPVKLAKPAAVRTANQPQFLEYCKSLAAICKVDANERLISSIFRLISRPAVYNAVLKLMKENDLGLLSRPSMDGSAKKSSNAKPKVVSSGCNLCS